MIQVLGLPSILLLENTSSTKESLLEELLSSVTDVGFVKRRMLDCLKSVNEFSL